MISSSTHRRNLASSHHPRRTLVPVVQKREWVPRGSITSSPPEDTPSVPPLIQEIQDKLARGVVQCLFCYDMIRRSASIWSCSACFSIFHLHCIRKWSLSPVRIASGDWCCPSCRTPQSIPARDISYTCFCGRCRDPPIVQDLTPHSCGKPCGKPLNGEGKEHRCSHVCVLQCHPGPCPPCMAFTSRRRCPCGKTNVVRRCSDRRVALSCGQPCNRLLSCGRHTCKRVCHKGACGSCQEFLVASCFCSKRHEVVLCGDVPLKKGHFDEIGGHFSCNNVCSRSLLCGNHVCRQICHPGLCGECELLPGKIRACHCGKKKFVAKRKSCLDLIPTCSEVCGKPLVCETHFCRMRCHEGDCSPCSVHVQQKCRCGSSRRTVECYKLFDRRFLFICSKICCQKKNCGRHRCNELCCVPSKSGDLDPHLCSLPCGKPLPCGNHTCQLLCHGGHCAPCRETILTSFTCACGKTSISPSIPCGTPVPSSPHQCSVPQPCGHPATHFCHFGKCPPCKFPVTKECIGGHVMLRNIPCTLKDISCNQPYRKTPRCGVHSCDRTSHPPCDSSPAPESESGERSVCGQVCGARRDCNHSCMAPCHTSSLCPEQRCKFEVAISCFCGRKSAINPCGTGTSFISFSNDALLKYNVIPEMLLLLQQVFGNEKEVLMGQRKLCDEVCSMAVRKKQLGNAVYMIIPDLDMPHIRDKLIMAEVFSDVMSRKPYHVTAIEVGFKSMVIGMFNEGQDISLKLIVFFHMLKDKKKDAVPLQITKRGMLPFEPADWECEQFSIIHVIPISKLNARFISLIPSVYDSLIDMNPKSVVMRIGGECELMWLKDLCSMAVLSDTLTINVCGVGLMAGNPQKMTMNLTVNSWKTTGLRVEKKPFLCRCGAGICK